MASYWASACWALRLPVAQRGLASEQFLPQPPQRSWDRNSFRVGTTGTAAATAWLWVAVVVSAAAASSSCLMVVGVSAVTLSVWVLAAVDVADVSVVVAGVWVDEVVCVAVEASVSAAAVVVSSLDAMARGMSAWAASTFGVPKKQVELLHGAAGRQKVLAVQLADAAALAAAQALLQQLRGEAAT